MSAAPPGALSLVPLRPADDPARVRLFQFPPPGRLICVQSSSHSFLLWFSVLRCVTGEDEVASFDSMVAGKAGVEHRLVGGFAVVELSEPPAARRRVFS